MIGAWMRGVINSRPGRVLGAAAGVAVTIALLGSLGIFLSDSVATMTVRAARDVAVGWQVDLAPSADEAKVLKNIGNTRAVAHYVAVDYADVAGMVTSTGGTTQVTGAGIVVGLGSGYASAFPNVFRQLAGKPGGVELAQQTAANLHAGVGDKVMIKRVDGTTTEVTVDGVVTNGNADAFFQAAGTAPGAAPTAPPDNVVYVPMDRWQSMFVDGPSGTRTTAGNPVTGIRQVHVGINTAKVPRDPSSAYVYVSSLAKNLEARAVGSVAVADNLASRLDSVRSDALYARVLFLFLGLPGAILSILITLSVVLTGSRHYALEQSLLRVRGANSQQVFSLEVIEAVGIGVLGILTGALLTFLSGTLIGNTARSIFSGANVVWFASTAAGVFVVVVGTLVGSVGSRLRETTSESSKSVGRPKRSELWRRLYLDWALLAIGLFVYWQTAKKGYQVVLAPEGTPTVSVHYDAFLAPFCLLVGGALVGLRLFEILMSNRRAIRMMLRPLAARLSAIASASLGRQSRFLARGVIMVALAVAFAVSTSVFNTTYNAQARVDAQLTNGADVTVTGRTSAPPGRLLPEIRKTAGVAAAESMMHRSVYVGNDLQDLYGIHPATIGNATTMSDAYFASGSAVGTLSMLAKNPSGVLVSEETKNDFQLVVGDTLNLRVQTAPDRQYRPVSFTFLGVVRKFPTAPKDSFIVANASYVAEQTAIEASEIVLVKTHGSASTVADAMRKVVQSLPGATVTDIVSTQKSINSNLTAVDLRGLSRLELLFAVLAVIGTAGLILALGLSERRRSFAILDAIGASRRQLGTFVWAEVLLVLISGTAIGVALGFSVSGMLVRILRGVFDPPPQHLAVPFAYLVLLLGAVALSAVGGALSTIRAAHRSVIENIRRL